MMAKNLNMQVEVSAMESLAKAESLVQWINSFGVSDVSSLKDLSSGHLLLRCMQKVIPQLCESSDEAEPWEALLQVLKDFYDCSLKESISLSEVQCKNEEHIARVIVLLLCLAVQQQPNEDVISQITSLDINTQQDMMFFIEDTTAKVNSHTIVRGTFTSGIGEPLLGRDEGHHSALPVQPPDSPKPPPVFCRPPSTPLLSRGKRKGPCVPPTPRSNCRQRISFYSGLESPAAVKWLTSPAIARSASSTAIHFECESQSEEVAKLQHRIRILQKTLDNETRLCTEFYTDLCQKTAEYSSIESKYLQRESMLERLEELQDTKDELDQKTTDLLKAEKALARYKHEVELLNGYKERTQILEAQMCNYNATEARLQELQQELDHVSAALIEKTADLKRVELRHQTTMVEVQTRTCELEDVIQQNRELSRIQRRLEEEKRELAMEVESAKADLLFRDSTLASLEQECQELREELEGSKMAFERQVEGLKEELELIQEKKISLEADLLFRDSTLASLEQECQELREELEGSKMAFERQVEGLKEELELIQEKKISLEVHLLVKDSAVTALEQECQKWREELESSGMICEKQVGSLKEELQLMQEQKKKLEADLSGRDCTVDSLEQECQKLKIELESSKVNFERQVGGLREELQVMQEKKISFEADLSVRNSAVVSLEQECQKLREELVVCKVNFEREVGSLKEELQKQKTALEDELAAKESALVEQSTKTSEELVRTRETLDQMREELQQVQKEKNSIEADLSSRVSTIASLEQECQKLMEELEGSKVNFERQVGGLKEELQLTQGKKISLENDLASLKQEWQKLKEELKDSKVSFDQKVEGVKEELQLMQEQKTSLEADVALKASVLVEQSTRSSEELEKVREILHTEVKQTKEELEQTKEELKLVQDQKSNIEADLVVRDAALASLQQECQKLRKELEGNAMNFERQVGGLKEELQLLQEKKTSLEAHLLVKDSTIASLEQEGQKFRGMNFEKQIGSLKEEIQLMQEQKNSLEVKYQSVIETQQQYEASLMQEKATVKAFREHLRRLQEQNSDINGQILAEKQQLQEELSKTAKLLMKEQQNRSKLTGENKSLKVQLSFASQKLRDFERAKSNQSSPSHFHRQSSRFGYSHAPSNCSYNPRVNEEFQIQLQREFDDSALTSTLPFELQEPLSEEEDSYLEDHLTSLSYPNFNASIKRATLAVPPSQSLASTSQSAMSHNSLAIMYQDPEEMSSKVDDKARIGELQRRNAKALPHLKSSYPIELQVQPESPSVSDESVKNGSKTNQPSQLTAKSTTFTAFEVPLDPLESWKSRKRTTSSRKKDGDFIPPVDVLTRSPIPSRRRISAPPTPKISLGRLQNRTAESRRFTIAPTSKLRELQDHEEQTCPDPLNLQRQSTAFEIDFSPPKAKGLPKRLQENSTRTTIKTSSTFLHPKPTVTRSKGKPSARMRRPPLKSKN